MEMMPHRYFSVIFFLLFLAFVTACSKQTPNKPLRIGFNTWPGYEFIYLAKAKRFYEKYGLDVKLVELSALGDVRRAFERGQIDIMASTMVEMLIAAENTGRLLKIIAVADASNGADMLLARKGIKSVAELKGKKVGMEGATVDVLVAGAALRSVGLKFRDIELVSHAQVDLVMRFEAGQLDAIQTYPPYAIKLLKTGKYHKLFDTGKIPGQIVDVLSVAEDVLSERRDDIRVFLKAYYEAFEYYQNNPHEASAIMGKREGISGDEFREALDGMVIFPEDKQLPYVKPGGVGQQALQNAAEVLHDGGWLKEPAEINKFFDARIDELIR